MVHSKKEASAPALCDGSGEMSRKREQGVPLALGLRPLPTPGMGLFWAAIAPIGGSGAQCRKHGSRKSLFSVSIPFGGQQDMKV